MSEFFPWKQELYTVGVAKIDEQHKKLISIINELFSAMKVGQSHGVIGKTLDELISYTKQHFHDEEELMEKAKYPALAKHKQIHVDLTKQVTELQTKFKSNPQMNISVETLDFLKDWLIKHIQGEDKKYAPFMIAESGH